MGVVAFLIPLMLFTSPPSKKVFEREELWSLTRSPSSSHSPPRLYLVVLGEVYDVSAGSQFYGPPEEEDDEGAAAHNDGNNNKQGKKQGYHIFIGQDSSASFSTGDWVTPVADVRPLGHKGAASVVEWRAFYRNHKTYGKVGVLHGLYYDASGAPTEALREVEALAAESRLLDDASQELEQRRYSGCGMSFVAATKETTIRCEDAKEPFLLTRRLLSSGETTTGGMPGSTLPHNSAAGRGAQEGDEKQWCSCLSATEDADLIATAAEEEEVSAVRQRKVEMKVQDVAFVVWAKRYEGCANGASVCVRRG